MHFVNLFINSVKERYRPRLIKELKKVKFLR